jgi:hypothetical protein
MRKANEQVEQVRFPRVLMRARRRDFVRGLCAIDALREVGCIADPSFTDDEGRPVSEEQARALREEIEPAVRELARGRAAHARRTVAEIEAGQKSDAGLISAILDALYAAHARGERSRDALGPFLDAFERWLTPDGTAKVEALFDRVELDRAPESLGILLLASTRLTRAHFARRAAFVERLRGWLVGRAGRTERSVDDMLRGLRE